jgi:hypothetical protein
MPLLAAPQASDVASLDLKPAKGPLLAPMPALPMLDFTRDVSGLTHRSSHPDGAATRAIEFARSHAKWLAMAGGTVVIAVASWMVFHAAAAGPESSAAATSSRAGETGTQPASTTARAAVTAQPAAPTQPAVALEPAGAATVEPVAAPAPDPAPAEQPEAPPAPVAAAAAARPAAEPTDEQEAPSDRPERTAPGAAAEPAARAGSAPRTAAAAERPASHTTAEPTTELPPARAPEPAPPPPRAAPAGPSVGEMDGTPDFDQSAAMAALRQSAESAKRCATSDPPSGGVRIAVTFARTGAVSATQVEGPAAGTPLGDCIVAKFQSAHVPPFRGSVMTVRKTVMF